MRRAHKHLLALGAGAAMFAALAGTAFASAPTGDFAPFSDCPLTVKHLSACVYSTTTGGTFTLGNEAVPITGTITLQGGYVVNSDDSETFHGAADGQTLIAPALTVPGGLLGLTIPSSVPEPLRAILEGAINTFNGVTATAELVGTPQFSFTNFSNASGTTVSLPIQVQLNNPFLGNSCYIGSASNPITLNLTDGTTSPPSGVAPLTGSTGTIGFLDNAKLVTSTGDSLVDNTFSVPAASGCGGIFSAIIDPIVDLKVGLPSAAGVSSAVMNGNAEIAQAKAVKKSEQ